MFGGLQEGSQIKWTSSKIKLIINCLGLWKQIEAMTVIIPAESKMRSSADQTKSSLAWGWSWGRNETLNMVLPELNIGDQRLITRNVGGVTNECKYNVWCIGKMA